MTESQREKKNSKETRKKMDSIYISRELSS